MAETLAMAGIDSFDLSVRPKGRVEPERGTDDLTRGIDTGQTYNLSTEMMVTSITDSNDSSTEKVLSTAAKLGIKHYRLGYYDYDFSRGISQSMQEIGKRLESLAQLNKTVGIQGGYQNHSGTRFGAPVWDVWDLIKNLPVEVLSSQFDVRHAVTEGASSWILALRLLGKNIGSLAIKDFTWQVTNRKAQVGSVPRGEGIVDFDLFIRTIKELNIVAPISLHIENPLLSQEEEKLTLLEKQKLMV
jgi:sugar phosphate isomerase/epimerase